MDGARFSPRVEAALRVAGWQPDRRLPAETVRALHAEMARQSDRFGGRLHPSQAAERVLSEFGGLVVDGDFGEDSALNPRPFALDPTMAAHCVHTLVDLGRAIGTGLYPIGVEGYDDAVLAVNDLGQVFAVDAVGDWYLGASIEEALTTLITGAPPVRVDDRGYWPGRVWDTMPHDPEDVLPIGGQKRPVGAAFFLPRAVANLYDVWLPATLRRIGIDPRAQDDPARLGGTWGGLDCEAHVLDLANFTVLVLSFELNDFLRQRAEVDRVDDLVDTTPVARAFAVSCRMLGEDLDVAFMQTRSTHHLLQYVTGYEPDVLSADSVRLVLEGFPLLYLSESYALGIEPALAGAPRDTLPTDSGLLIFRGTGSDRW